MNRAYIKLLEKLKQEADAMPNTPHNAFGKVLVLYVLNMRYEKIMVDKNLPRHPYGLVAEFIEGARVSLDAWRETSFTEKEEAVILDPRTADMSEFHRQLFQNLWNNFGNRSTFHNDYDRMDQKALLIL